MISEFINAKGVTTYKVRVFSRGQGNSLLRVTRQKGGVTSLIEAKKLEVKLKKECERELHGLEARGILWCDLLESWSEHQTNARVNTGHILKMTHDDAVASINKWFGEFDRRPAVELNSFALIKIFEKMKANEMTVKHQKKMRRLIKSIFDYGIGSGFLPNVQRSPTLDIVLKRADEKKPEILSLKELQLLMQRAFEEKHPWRKIWAVALLTGMRSGELYALEWKDVDFENKIISVTKSFNCRLRTIKSTKAGYWRQVPISQSLMEILKSLKAETGNMPQVFDRHWKWTQGFQAEVLREFCFFHQIPSIKFHTLRACFATQMLRQGVEAAKVMKICGWKELKTMQIYIRLAGIEVEGATEGLEICKGIGPVETSPDVTLL